jgi:signal transduction histidine kinase
MRTLAASFIGIGVVIFAALGFELWQGTVAGAYLKTIANLGSLLPSALLAYYIYRYRYLEIIIEKSLVVVTFATVVLTVYVFGIRTIGDWMTRAYGVRPGLVEALLILALALLAAPLRGWLAQRFHKLFEREAALYKEILSRIGAYAGQYKDLSDLLHFVEERTTQALGLRKLKIFTEVSNSWVKDALDLSQVNGWETLEDEPLLLDHGFKLGYPMRREDKIEGLLAVDGSPSTLTTDVRSVMELLAGQVAIAIDDSRLLAENLRLERELAERERLALLGRMAATVAHEIKNPLSAIKSIAQVMREDEQLSHEYERDLRLIVGETDRLSQSVTQLLSFARKESAAEQPQTVEELLNSVVHLFQANAREQGVNLTCANRCDATLSGKCVSALRDAVSNLLLNALQATPSGGEVKLVAEAAAGELLISVADSGAGVPAELRERIWEPFFTTRQRGTGLGLAIVRKRVQEVGGSASLAVSSNGRGAVFQLRLPLDSK